MSSSTLDEALEALGPIFRAADAIERIVGDDLHGALAAVTQALITGRREAWDEGYHVGVAHAQMKPGTPFKSNPYGDGS